MQSILALEEPFDDSNARSSFEISLLLLDINGYDEVIQCPYSGLELAEGSDPIISYIDIDDEFAYDKFLEANLASDAVELTNEIEASLIQLFQPHYNRILFDNYPNISNGTRSAGYSQSFLTIESIPVCLYTEHHIQNPVLRRK